MSKIRVQRYQTLGYATVDDGATQGATIGEDVFNADGSLFSPLQVTALANVPDDASAAAAGVLIGGLYRNGSVLMVRVS
ncbi:hypothetical protein [Pseudoxanthomonas winnipegensis]|uniref:hypothetical protein n=1 Tax=Pseudoxanthomonas winnipegensis TaxID=2480810 RepID=UPI00102DB559|nr:hypothetical protein [Pseudoxanthomonas winnipegensis]RZZ85695.1 hypothetical protein EA663_11850 [Pseudoxanthomonas winnipegensis]